MQCRMWFPGCGQSPAEIAGSLLQWTIFQLTPVHLNMTPLTPRVKRPESGCWRERLRFPEPALASTCEEAQSYRTNAKVGRSHTFPRSVNVWALQNIPLGKKLVCFSNTPSRCEEDPEGPYCGVCRSRLDPGEWLVGRWFESYLQQNSHIYTGYLKTQNVPGLHNGWP